MTAGSGESRARALSWEEECLGQERVEDEIKSARRAPQLTWGLGCSGLEVGIFAGPCSDKPPADFKQGDDINRSLSPGGHSGFWDRTCRRRVWRECGGEQCRQGEKMVAGLTWKGQGGDNGLEAGVCLHHQSVLAMLSPSP